MDRVGNEEVNMIGRRDRFVFKRLEHVGRVRDE